MSNNLPFENEEEVIETAEGAVEAAEETVEETVEEAAEAAEEAVEEIADAVEEVAETLNVSPDDVQAVSAPEMPKKKNSAQAAIVVVVVLAIALSALVYTTLSKGSKNPYNEMGYVNASGRTLDEVIEATGTYESLEEFLAEYDLPADMPGDTTESAAYYNIPLAKIAEMYGMTSTELKETLKLDETITDDTPWGIAEGEAILANYIGEENLESFKEYYGLGDDITGETQWKEIRNIVDTKTMEEQQAAKEAAAQAAVDGGLVAEDVVDIEGAEIADGIEIVTEDGSDIEIAPVE